MSNPTSERPALPDNLYWKGNKIYFVVSHNGKTAKGTTGTSDIKKATAHRDKIKAKLVLGDKTPTGRAVLITELLDDYLANLKRRDENKGAYGKKSNAKKTGYTVNKHVRPYFGKTRADKLGTALLNAYVDDRKAEYRAKGEEEGSWIVSVNRELTYLRAAMKLGLKATPQKVFSVPSFPIDAKAEKAKRRKGFVKPDQYELLMKHLSDHMKPVLPFVMYSGVRAGELKFIRREQIDWSDMVIHLRAGETKDGDERDVPIVSVAVDPLIKWIGYTEEFFPACPWLFHYDGKQINEWRTAWDNACRRAGLQKPRLNSDGTPKLHQKGKNKGKPIMENLVKFHDTRRTAITHQGRAGVTEADSMRNTGHKTIELHRGYDQDRDAAMRTAAALNQYIEQGHVSKPQPELERKASLDMDALKELVSMRKDGMLTEQEFTELKARL